MCFIYVVYRMISSPYGFRALKCGLAFLIILLTI
nr:MAG TPA: hypothetical protein [Microviridae sp.]